MPVAAADDLAGLPLFEELDEATCAAIAPWFEVQDASPGVRLTGEGASGYSFFVLSDGTASVSIDGAEVNALGPGDFFGELAILGDGRSAATVTTTSPSPAPRPLRTRVPATSARAPGAGEPDRGRRARPPAAGGVEPAAANTIRS